MPVNLDLHLAPNANKRKNLSFKGIEQPFSQLNQSMPAALPTKAPVVMPMTPTPTFAPVQNNDTFTLSTQAPSQAPAPTVSDIEPKNTDKKKVILDNVLKYSGLVALAAVPVVAVVLGKSIKGNSEKFNKAATEIKNTVNRNHTEVLDALKNQAQNTLGESKVRTIVEESTKPISEKMGTVLAALGASALGVTLLTKKSDGTTDKVVVTGNGITLDTTNGVTKDDIKAISKASPSASKQINIWGDLDLNLNAKKRLSEKTQELIGDEITRSLYGEIKAKEVENPVVGSISYEGWGHALGGQGDIAQQMPAALKEQGIDSIVFAPLLEVTLKDKTHISGLTDLGNGKYKYFAPKFKDKTGIEVQRVFGKEGDDMQVFYGEADSDNVSWVKKGEKQKVLFLYNPKYFKLDRLPCVASTMNTYMSTPKSPLELRMAKLNSMTYDTLIKLKEGELKTSDGEVIKPVDKLVMHEAWHSGGLAAKLKLLTHAQEASGELKKDTAEHLRELSDNSAIVVHNLGNAYQGQVGDDRKDIMEKYLNEIYGDYAHDIVYSSIIEENKGSEQQRAGFIGDVMNPAHLSVVLSSQIGPVSEGFREEILQEEDGLSAKLTPTIINKNTSGRLVAFPNGIDKWELAASTENVDKINDKFKESLGDKKVIPYIDKYTDKIDADNPDAVKAFDDAKKHNTEIFVDLLKASTKGASPLIAGNKNPEYAGSVNIDDITADTPIFSIATRPDDQKGLDTLTDAYALKVNELVKNDPKADIPVLMISYGKMLNSDGTENTKLKDHLEGVKKDLGNNGRRMLITQNRMDNEGLLLMNMTTRPFTPSDFEPCGIADAKGYAAGSHGIVHEVGGMRPEGDEKTSRKTYTIGKDGIKKATATTVANYDPMCLVDTQKEKDKLRVKNARNLKAAMDQDMALSHSDSIRMDINALNLDVSWNKGAIQNYMNRLGIVKKAAS